MSEDKSGSPPCGIYVRIDEYADMQKIITGVRQMALVINRASGYEKNMHVVELAYRKEDTEKINDLVTILQAQGLIAILAGAKVEHSEVFPEVDGFLAGTPGDFEALKTALPEEKIIGITGADHIPEQADYAVVTADPAALMKTRAGTGDVLLCASGKGITNDTVGVLARAGASFVDATDYILTHEKGVMQGAVNILHALELALEDEILLKN